MDEINMYVNSLLEEFSKKLPRDEKNLIRNYKEYLDESLRNIEQTGETIDIQLKKDFLRLKANYIINLPDLDSVKRVIVYDRNFEEITIESGKIFNEACEVLKGNMKKSSINLEEKIKKLEEILGEVKEFNFEQARLLISEASLDKNYIENPSTNILSFRLSRMKKMIEKESETNTDR